MVRYACIMHGPFDRCRTRRIGGVMGSKNLKAVAVRGHKAPDVVRPELLKRKRLVNG